MKKYKIYGNDRLKREGALNFTAPMAAAIWRGDKWMTRRTVRVSKLLTVLDGETPDPKRYRLQPGDTAVIREPWRTARNWDDKSTTELVEMSKERIAPTPIAWSDGTTREVLDRVSHWGRLRQAMHLPFQFARMRRKVLSVRAERLWDISEADAQAEGIYSHDFHGVPAHYWGYGSNKGGGFDFARQAFEYLWEEVHGKGAWGRDAKFWVWVIEFERKAGA